MYEDVYEIEWVLEEIRKHSNDCVFFSLRQPCLYGDDLTIPTVQTKYIVSMHILATFALPPTWIPLLKCTDTV